MTCSGRSFAISVLAVAGLLAGSVTPSSGAVSYVGRVASSTSSSSSTASTLTSSRQVASGDAVIVAVLLSSTSTTGAVNVTDSAGNTYALDRDQNDSSAGDRVLVFSSLKAGSLPAGGTIRITYPSAAECHASADEFSGLAARDRVASAWGASSGFNSGLTATTTQSGELLFGAVGNESGGSPTWAAGWNALPLLAVSSDHLGAAYRVSSGTGQFAASGTVSGTWMAAITTYTTGSGTSTDSPPVARLSVTQSATPPLTAKADGSASTDADQTPIASYRFTFGDGSSSVTVSAPSATASHTYASAGTYTVTLVATDTGGNASAPASAQVVVSSSTSTGGVAVYAGYYDTHHASTNPKPSPWKGSSNVVFRANPDSGTTNGWDSSAIRVDNLGSGSISCSVTCDIGNYHYALWSPASVPAGYSLIVAQTANENFDGSDTNPAGCFSCSPNDCLTKVVSTVPVVHVTIGGATTNYYDTNQVLNTKGVDSAGCPYTGTRNDESTSWRQIFTGGTASGAEPTAPRLADRFFLEPGLALEPPRPNPARDEVQFRFQLGAPGRVALTIYDVTGRSERSLADVDLEPGIYRDLVSVRGLPTGMHYLRLVTPEGTRNARFVVVR